MFCDCKVPLAGTEQTGGWCSVFVDRFGSPVPLWLCVAVSGLGEMEGGTERGSVLLVHSSTHGLTARLKRAARFKRPRAFFCLQTQYLAFYSPRPRRHSSANSAASKIKPMQKHNGYIFTGFLWPRGSAPSHNEPFVGASMVSDEIKTDLSVLWIMTSVSGTSDWLARLISILIKFVARGALLHLRVVNLELSMGPRGLEAGPSLLI